MRHAHMERVRTLPFSVVTANNLASTVAPEDSRIECVVVQASVYNASKVNLLSVLDKL